MARGLSKRLDKLEPKHTPEWTIQVWLHDLDGETVLGPDGQTHTTAEAERLLASADLVVELRRPRA